MNSWVRAAVVPALVAVVLGSAGAVAGQSSASLPPNATKVTVHAGETTAHVNAKLTQGSAIAGQVTDEEANPLQSAEVSVLTPSGRSLGRAYTDTSGNYRVTSLPPTSSGYAVCVNGAPASSSVRPVSYGYLSACNGSTKFWWPGRKPPSDARRIATSVGTAETANMILSDAGGITGTITSRASGDKLVGAYAYAYTSSGYTVANLYSSDGTFQIKGLPAGAYRVCFEPPYPNTEGGTGYAPQCYKDVKWADNGQPASKAKQVHVTVDNAVETDQSLPWAGAITGSVRTTSKPSHPIQGANIQAMVGHKVMAVGYPGRKGNYRIEGLAAGKYKVCAYRTQRIFLSTARTEAARRASGHGIEANGANGGSGADASPIGAARGSMAAANRALAGSSGAAQCWKDTPWNGNSAAPKQARTVHVHAHKSASGIDFRLRHLKTPSSGISGRITSPSGAGVANAAVFAFGPHGRYGGEAGTNKHGKYRLDVPASKAGYRVCAAGPRELEVLVASPQQFGARCWKSANWIEQAPPKDAAAVTVEHGHVHKGINIKLPKAGKIAGQVTFGGQPVSDVEVVVVSHGNFVTETFTDDDGEYVVDGLSPAKHAYNVCFATVQSSTPPTLSPDYGFRPQCFRNQPWDESGVG